MAPDQKRVWVPERVASRVRALASEHGAPNRFQLHELAGDTDGRSILDISRIARLQAWAVNRHLEKDKLQIAYQTRQGPGSPAYVIVRPA